MEETIIQYVCVQIYYPNKPWFRYDTLSWGMANSKKIFLGKGTMTWKECYKLGWRCLKVTQTLKTFK